MKANDVRRTQFMNSKTLYSSISINLILLVALVLFSVNSLKAEEYSSNIAFDFLETIDQEPEQKQIDTKVSSKVIHSIDPIKLTIEDRTNINNSLNALNKAEEQRRNPRTLDHIDPVPINQIAVMAIYPGCEGLKNSKPELVKCFSKKLSEDIVNYLDTDFPELDKNIAQVQLEFLVDNKGNIVNVIPVKGDDEFKPQAKRALEKVATKLRNSSNKIQPAMLADGSKVSIIFRNSLVLKNPNY